jgi:rootletin
LHARLRDIAQAVINDDQDAFNLSLSGEGGRHHDRSCSPRSRSPGKRQFGSRPASRCSSPFADATFSAVQAALNKRQLQMHDLKTKLDNCREANQSLKRQIDDLECDNRKYEQCVNDLRLQLENIRRSADETSRERDHSKQHLETVSYEKSNLEKVRMALVNQTECLRIECEKLQAANTELQRQRDQLEDEKDDIIKDKLRQVKENERCYKVIEQLENKLSCLKKELSDFKEALSRVTLERDVVTQDKNITADALSRSEIQKAELELDINKMKAEEAKLRDLLIKMQSLNEALTQDKVELNKLIIHLEQEKACLSQEKSDLEMVKNSLKAELVKVEQEKQDLENERESKNFIFCLI